MSTPIIEAEQLSKRYFIGRKRDENDGLRHALDQALRNPIRWIIDKKTRTAPEEFWALSDVSFSINQGDAVGIIGRNGAGKSTLLKILSRITEPTRGRIRCKGRVASLLEVGTGFHPDLTGRENVFLNGAILGMTRAEIKRKFDDIVAFSELERFIDTPVKRYSSGMYVRLAFSIAAHLEPDVMVVDEVLAVGDSAFQRKCMGRMTEVTQGGRTVLFVSHNLAAVANLCSKGFVLEKGRLMHVGPVESAVAFYYSTMEQGIPRSQNDEGHVLYSRAGDDPRDSRFAINRIELLDGNKRPKTLCYTLDEAIFRIHYESPQPVKRASVVFGLTSLEGSKLLLLSTQPDGNLELEFARGQGVVDLSFPELPLAAGLYTIGAGLAIPNAEFLCWNPQICEFNVLPKDSYQSGFAPVSSRCLLAVRHRWEVPL